MPLCMDIYILLNSSSNKGRSSLHFSLLLVLSALFSLNSIDTSTSVALGLGGCHVFNLVRKTLRALLCFPGVWTLRAEQDFNFLDGLAACLWICEEELNRGQDAEGSEEQEQAVFDVAESGRDKETDGKVELIALVRNGRKGDGVNLPASCRWRQYPCQWHGSQGTKPRRRRSSRPEQE